MFSNSELNKIKNLESRRNFELVLQSYYSKNNKAAVLLLYNLLVNDLYNKLILMTENGYVNCENELNKIENDLKEKSDSKYSEIEERIFSIYKTKKLLNHSMIDLLIYFKRVRNKCAHPFFFKENDYTPSDDELYLFITRIYNEILIVDAFFKNPYDIIKKDFDTFQFPDLEGVLFGISNKNDNIAKVEQYFTKKYYKYMTDNNYIKLFKSLVELTIRKNTQEILSNQYMHYLLICSLLNYLQKNGKISILNNSYEWYKIKTNYIYDDFDKNIFEQQCFSLSYLFRILSYNYSFIEELRDKNDDVYEMVTKKLYEEPYLFIEYWNLFDSDINNAIIKLSNQLSYDQDFKILKKLKEKISKQNIIKLLRDLLNKIPRYDAYNQADEAIELVINILENRKNDFTQNDIDHILEIMNSNPQIYKKARIMRDSQVSKIISLGYNLGKYENLSMKVDD